MKAPYGGSRKQELAREEVHLDLPPLLAAVVDNSVKADRRSFGRTREIDLLRRRRVAVVAEFGVADLMGDEEGPFEWCAGIFVENEAVARDKHRATAVEHGGAFCSNFDIEAPARRFGLCERIRLPGIVPLCDCLLMELGGGLPGEFDRIHVSRRRRGAARASRRARLRRSEVART